jgi:hypothetical protein
MAKSKRAELFNEGMASMTRARRPPAPDRNAELRQRLRTLAAERRR